MSQLLLQVIEAGDLSRAQALLAAGADCDARNADGATALMLAAHLGRLDMVHALIDAGADVNATDERGWGPMTEGGLQRGSRSGICRRGGGADPGRRGIETPITYGVRPLMLAAGYGETAVVETLLKAGADVLARNDGGLTALMMVKEKFYVDVINLLHEAERDAGVGEGSCSTKNAPGSQVVTFLKPVGRRADG